LQGNRFDRQGRVGYSNVIRSERQPIEQRDYNLMFRWFAGLAMDAPVWGASTFSKNRERVA
jgi:transposase